MIRIPFTKTLSYLDSRKRSFELFDEIARNIDMSEKKIFLFNLPSDSNLGDHAQTVCTLDFLRRKNPQHRIYAFPTLTNIPLKDMKLFLERLSLLVSEYDIIVFHSGYHINDIYCNLYDSVSPTAMLQMATLSVFTKNRIIYFPQTINLSEENFSRYAENLSRQKNVTLMCRDKISFLLASRHFQADCRLVPDIVTIMIGTFVPIKKKRKIKRALIALRNRTQKESLVATEQIESIETTLLDKGFSICYGGTYIDEPYEFIIRNTERVVKNKIEDFSSYDLIVTDLYHGMIFSVIANTPVVVLPSSDHKISSGVQFFRESKEFDRRVYFFDSIEDYVPFIRNLQDSYLFLEPPTPYFYEKYYKELEI